MSLMLRVLTPIALVAAAALTGSRRRLVRHFQRAGAKVFPGEFHNYEGANMNRFFQKPQGLRSILAAAGAAAALLSAACAPPKADTAALAAALTQLDDDWSKAAATRNAESVGAFYAADAIAYPPDMPVAIGHDAATKVWADGFADSSYRISWKTDHAGASESGELGFTTGNFDESYRAPDGKVIARKGKYVCVWRKQPDGTWKAIHDTWNYDAK
jgi:ketosteroid isomerase-like protein